MRALLAAAVFAALVAVASGARSGPIDFPGAGGTVVSVVSQKAARFRATQQQSYDFSCGSAALATLLTYHYGRPTSEAEVFEAMFKAGDVEKIRAEGFSLLDIKRYLGDRGFQADGFELPLESLLQERVPAIVLISEKGYNHFVVVKGIRDGRVLIGDPSAGLRALPRARFEQAWTSRILFVIHNQQDLASFNTAADWHGAPAAPLAEHGLRSTIQPLVPFRLGHGEY